MEVVGTLTLAFLFLAVAGWVWQAVESRRDVRRNPPPGQMLDVEGRRLHLRSLGQGSPVVVLEAGLGGSSVGWCRVQPEVAKFTRVVSYDRAGMGWSEPASNGRSGAALVEELRMLLRKAGIPPPYVLVGHSFGAYVVELFAASSPNEVAGLVLVDPLPASEWYPLTDRQKARLAKGVRLAGYAAALARFGVARLFLALVMGPRWATRLFMLVVGVCTLAAARINLRAVGGGLRGAERMRAGLEKLPAEAVAQLRALWSRPTYFQAWAQELENLPESAAQVATRKIPREIPLTVMSAGSSSPGRLREHERLAGLSARGRHLMVLGSGHLIQLNAPAIVVEAIRNLIIGEE